MKIIGDKRIKRNAIAVTMFLVAMFVFLIFGDKLGNEIELKNWYENADKLLYKAKEYKGSKILKDF